MFINKEKINKNVFLLVIPIALWGSLLFVSPAMNRSYELDQDFDKTTIKEEVAVNDKQTDSHDKTDEKIAFVYQNYNPAYLPAVFFEEYYPIKYDKDFWYDFVNKYRPEDTNYRLIENEIIKRVVEINNNKYDKFFGIGNSTVQHIVNLERDFLLHYYTYGIIGSILLLIVYIIMPIIALIKFVKEKNYYSFIIALGVFLFILSAYLTGNIINSMTTIIAFALISSGINLREQE